MSMRYYYSKQGSNERHGPVAAGDLVHLCRSGQLDPLTLLVCREGGEWTKAVDDPALGLVSDAQMIGAPGGSSGGASGGAVGGAIGGQPGGLGYFSAGMDINGRAKANLVGYATATGPRGEWPLNGEQLRQFAVAAMLRKRILGAYNLLRLFFLLSVIGSAIMLLAVLIGFAASRPGRATAGAMEMAIPMAFVIGVTVLYGFCMRATYYCRSWGPLVPGILTAIGMLFSVGSFVLLSMAAPNAGGAGIAGISIILQLLIGGAFAFVFFRAFAAIGPYLNTPIWCQEALAVSERAK